MIRHSLVLGVGNYVIWYGGTSCTFQTGTFLSASLLIHLSFVSYLSLQSLSTNVIIFGLFLEQRSKDSEDLFFVDSTPQTHHYTTCRKDAVRGSPWRRQPQTPKEISWSTCCEPFIQPGAKTEQVSRSTAVHNIRAHWYLVFSIREAAYSKITLDPSVRSNLNSRLIFLARHLSSRSISRTVSPMSLHSMETSKSRGGMMVSIRRMRRKGL